MMGPGAAALVVCALLLLFASAHDVATRTIPNWVSLALAAIGVALRLAEGNLPCSLLAASLIFGASACCWRHGWLGGGDVKLLTACALLSPPVLVPTLLFGTALAGGLLAMTYLTLRYLISTLDNLDSLVTNPGEGRGPTAFLPHRESRGWPPFGDHDPDGSAAPDVGMTRPGGPIAARRPASLAARLLRAEAWRIRRGGPLPYACAICAGALFVLIGQ